jgi:hypothetical protein
MVTDHVTFSSPHFKIEPGEDEATNPGIYGKALAEWMAAQLRRRGIAVEDVFAEDFGWCVMVKRKPIMLWVACANLDDRSTGWQMYIALERGLMARLRGVDGRADLEQLRTHYRALVTEIPDVANIAWQAGTGDDE